MAEQLKKTQEPNKRNRQNQKTIFTTKMRQENWKRKTEHKGRKTNSESQNKEEGNKKEGKQI